jgi:hypothetical protein
MKQTNFLQPSDRGYRRGEGGRRGDHTTTIAFKYHIRHLISGVCPLKICGIGKRIDINLLPLSLDFSDSIIQIKKELIKISNF